MSDCPVCQSTNVKKLKFNSQGGGQLQVAADRECLDCGTIWRPATQRWVGWVLLAFALLFLVFALKIVLEPAYSPMIVTFKLWTVTASGLLFLAFLIPGMRAVLGKSRGVHVLRVRKGDTADRP